MSPLPIFGQSSCYFECICPYSSDVDCSHSDLIELSCAKWLLVQTPLRSKTTRLQEKPSVSYVSSRFRINYMSRKYPEWMWSKINSYVPSIWISAQRVGDLIKVSLVVSSFLASINVVLDLRVVRLLRLFST